MIKLLLVYNLILQQISFFALNSCIDNYQRYIIHEIGGLELDCYVICSSRSTIVGP